MKYIMVLAACISVSACVTKSNPAKTEVTVPGIGSATYHCPPGQAKKGNC